MIFTEGTAERPQAREIRGLLWPLQPMPLFFFLSHKVSRLLVPFGMVAALIANLWLLDQPLYQLLFLGQANGQRALSSRLLEALSSQPAEQRTVGRRPQLKQLKTPPPPSVRRQD